MAVTLAISVFLTGSVFLPGGVYSREWEWCALVIGIASVLAFWAVPKRRVQFFTKTTFGLGAMALLLGWMIFQLIPLPPGVISHLSPVHWKAITAARMFTGRNTKSWVAPSLAPALTIERLLYVAPAMAAFVTAREMGCWWPDRMWIVVAPVIGVAWLESLLGIAQFYFMRVSLGAAGQAHGTYVNHDHFAGLLEMALPLALLWPVAIWREFTESRTQRASPAFQTAFLLVISGCLLIGVIVSLSRMGFTSTLISMAVVMGLFAYRSDGNRRDARKWLLSIAVLLPVLIALFLPTPELIVRFAELTPSSHAPKDTRTEVWRDTRKVISDYRWTGTGLGAYGRGFYIRKADNPDNSVDFAHNDYLQILAELGIIGATLALTAAVWIASRVLSVSLRRGESLNRPLAVGLTGTLLALGVHSGADFNLYIPANALAFAWLGGVATSPGLDRR